MHSDQTWYVGELLRRIIWDVFFKFSSVFFTGAPSWIKAECLLHGANNEAEMFCVRSYRLFSVLCYDKNGNFLKKKIHLGDKTFLWCNVNHLFIIYTRVHCEGHGGWSLSNLGQDAGYTFDKLPGFYRTDTETHLHTDFNDALPKHQNQHQNK